MMYQDNHRGGSRDQRETTYIRAGDFKAKKDVIRTVTLDEIEEKVLLEHLHPDTQKTLTANGVKELMPV